MKIFNRIWNRERYCEHIDGQVGWYNSTHIKKFSVQNWYVASINDWENLFNGLKNANISLPAQYMSNANGGRDLTGFNIEFNEGWIGIHGEIAGKNGNWMNYLTGKRDSKGNYSGWKLVEFNKNGLGHCE